MKKRTTLNDDLLVSETRHHSPHSYGVDLSLISMEKERDGHEKTCHFCCLFATACPHSSSINSQHLKRSDRININENAIGSLIDIWKDSSMNVSSISSALVDVPECFREISKKPIVSNTSLWNKDEIDDNETRSHRSLTSLLRRLPSPPRTPVSSQSSTSTDLSEPILFKDQISSEDLFIDRLIVTKSPMNENENENQILDDSTPTSARKRLKIVLENEVATTDSPSSKGDFPVTISQYIRDVHTKIDAQVEAEKSKPLKSIRTPTKFQPLKTLPENICPRCGFQLITFPFESTKKNASFMFDNSKMFPTVPQCVNGNATKSRLNLFDSKLFKWKFFDEKNQNTNANYYCRRFSHRNAFLFVNNNKNSTSTSSSWITMLHYQRQLVPLEYSSWNISYPCYSPPNFSLHRSNSNSHSQKKNPFGRTGLNGQSVFSVYGPNRYFILFFLHQHDEDVWILLEKSTESDKWLLPKTNKKPMNFYSRALISGYVDHPLNTDQSWLEIELILIKINDKYLSSRQSKWFSLDSILTFDHIEKFDRHLIKSYLFK